MSDVPMPRDLSEEAVAEWLFVHSDPFNESRVPWGGLYDGERNKWRFLARAVRALLRTKARAAVAGGYAEGYRDHRDRDFTSDSDEQRHIDEVVSRVMGGA